MRARAAAACCTRPPAPARPTRCGSARCGAAARGIRRGARRRAAARALDHADARARRRHAARAAARRCARPGAAPGPSACAPATRRRPSARGRTGACRPRWSRRRRALTLHALARRRARRASARCDCVVVDEWHELIGNKRGVQVQLALARLRRWQPGAGRLGPVGHARQPGRGAATRCSARDARAGAALVRGRDRQDSSSSTRCCPADAERFSVGRPPGPADAAAGGRGDRAAAARRWSSPTCARRPRSGTRRCSRRGRTGPGSIALHHGSLDRERARLGRAGPEGRRAEGGGLHLVSLDLGVDFLPVERVLQIGSRQGRRAPAAARRPQRPRAGPAVARHAGADQHPGARRSGRGARARRRPAASRARQPPDKPLDVLVQHLVTVALGGGFRAGRAVRGSAQRLVAYRELTRDELALGAGLRRARRREPGRLSRVPPRRCRTRTASGACRTRGIARRHRMNIGTIVSDAAMQVKYLTRRRASAASRRASSRG